MSSRKNRKPSKSKPGNSQCTNDRPRRPDGPVDDVALMREIAREQWTNKQKTSTSELSEADAGDPFETNQKLRQFIQNFMAKATEIRQSEEAGWRATRLAANCTE